MDEEIKGLIEQQGKAFEEFKKTNDARLKAIEEGKGVAEFEAKLTKINTDLTDISGQISNLNKKANRPEIGAEDLSQDEADHKNALYGPSGYMRKGTEDGLRDLERKTLRAGSDPDSGYFLAPTTVGAIGRVLTSDVSMRRLATVTQIGTSEWKEPMVTSGASSGWVGETGSRAATTTPKISEIKIALEECYAMPAAYTRTLEDSSVNLESWLVDESGISFTDEEGEAFITGNGVNKPRGITTYTMIANTSYTWGKIGYVASGKAGAFADANPEDSLIDLIHALKRGHRNGAAFMMSDSTLATVRKFKDGFGNYIWQPSLQLGVPDMLLGYPVETDDYMPSVDTNTYPIAFGNFKRAYRIVDGRGITILRDPYTTKGLVYFYMTRRVGGGVKNFEAIKFLKMAAS
ncbi:MAG: phage major capsid protein [Bacteroidales bacterium]|nr:phage major capsid protein [Bacteroidales bacterium]